MTIRTAAEVLRSLKMRVARLEGGNTRKTANNVASEIVDQLGGARKLQVFIGLKGLKSLPNGVELHFNLFPHAGAVNVVRITLNGLDLYDLEFIRVRGAKMKVVSTAENVYSSELRRVFEAKTGLAIGF